MSNEITRRQEALFCPVQPDDIPAEVAEKLLRRASLYIPAEEAPTSLLQLSHLRTFTHENDDVTYLADHLKTYTTGMTERLIYIVDTSSDGDVIGEGEVRYCDVSDNRFFSDKPFVGMTSTIPDRQNEGLGARRLLLMRLAAVAEYGLELHSDTILCDVAARATWERMVKRGLAERYIQQMPGHDGSLRYRFK